MLAAYCVICFLRLLLTALQVEKTVDVLIDLFVDAKHLLNPVQLSAATFTRMSLPCNADDAGWQVTNIVQLMS